MGSIFLYRKYPKLELMPIILLLKLIFVYTLHKPKVSNKILLLDAPTQNKIP